jgi:hypothetical protein
MKRKMSEKSISFNGSAIPEKRLRDIWNREFSNKPFPHVKAYFMRKREFDKLIKQSLFSLMLLMSCRALCAGAP